MKTILFLSVLANFAFSQTLKTPAPEQAPTPAELAIKKVPPNFKKPPEKLEDQKKIGDELIKKVAEKYKGNVPDANYECLPEIARYCPNFPRGASNLIACLLYIPKEKKSEKCQNAVDAADLSLAVTRNRFAICTKDFNANCKGVPLVPNVNIVRCMLKNYSKLSQPCRVSMKEVHLNKYIDEKFKVIKIP